MLLFLFLIIDILFLKGLTNNNILCYYNKVFSYSRKTKGNELKLNFVISYDKISIHIKYKQYIIIH